MPLIREPWTSERKTDFGRGKNFNAENAEYRSWKAKFRIIHVDLRFQLGRMLLFFLGDLRVLCV
jgi:hypothetical protein